MYIETYNIESKNFPTFPLHPTFSRHERKKKFDLSRWKKHVRQNHWRIPYSARLTLTSRWKNSSESVSSANENKQRAAR